MERIVVPVGLFSAEEQDAAARQRAILAEKLRNNEEVVVSGSGELEVENPDDDSVKLVTPKGVLADR